MILALLQQKGGGGKTTLATHLAGALASPQASVLVIDADPQGSALDWSQRRTLLGLPRRFGVIGLARETLHQEVPQIARHTQHVIIDGPPRVTALARSAILAADLVLIPVQPSNDDLKSCHSVARSCSFPLIPKQRSSSRRLKPLSSSTAVSSAQ
jgi:chromosome partitioning protein